MKNGFEPSFISTFFILKFTLSNKVVDSIFGLLSNYSFLFLIMVTWIVLLLSSCKSWSILQCEPSAPGAAYQTSYLNGQESWFER